MDDSGTTGTTAAPNSTTGMAETALVPDTTTEKTANASGQPPTDIPAKMDEKVGTNGETTKATPIQDLWSLAKSHGHPEIWGVILADPETHIPSQIILQKYLNAKNQNLVQAKEQLKATLDWRAKMRPIELMTEMKHASDKFDGLGFVTTYGKEGGDPEDKEVFTWNVYGIAKDQSYVFGDQEQFIAWRVALMELALQYLDIDKATKPITADYDPYKIFQVHDYKSVSFLRQNPKVKAVSKETIRVFGQNYPELLKEKFFVNVPVIMGVAYAMIKLFVDARTAKKFHPMSNGGGLVYEFGESKVAGLGEMLPNEYGGKGEDLRGLGKQPLLT